MQTITRTDLRDSLLARRGASAVSIVSHTEPRFRKKLDGQPNPYLGEVFKVSHVNGMINWRYANAVNNQRYREDQPQDDAGNVEHFEALPRKWGKRLSRPDGTITPLVEHKGNYYLEMKVERSLGHQYRGQDGTVHADEIIQPWLLARSKSKRQQTDKEIILRDYALDSIQQIRLDGEILAVVD